MPKKQQEDDQTSQMANAMAEALYKMMNTLGNGQTGEKPKAKKFPKEHTLEKICKAAVQKGKDEDQIYSALLLSFTAATYNTMRKGVVPSYLFRVSYDPKDHRIDITELQGNCPVLKANAMDINALDLLIACALRDIAVLWEGETGIGKTFLSEGFLNTVLDKDNYVGVRLSGNIFVNNIFQPFLEGKIENGLPKTIIKDEAVRRTAAMHIDEINRGDPQSILQLLDSKLYNAGEFRNLGIPIYSFERDSDDEITTGKFVRDKSGNPSIEAYKKLFIVSAENPASTSDAKFTGTIELDAAVDNRLLKVYFGNGSNSCGSSLWLSENGKDPHKLFLEEFAQRASGYLGIDKKNFDNVKDDWLGLYSYITDPEWTEKYVIYSSLELADMFVYVMSGNLIQNFEREKNIINEWNDVLKTYNMNMQVTTSLDKTAQVEKIEEIIGTFKEPIIYRDVIQIKKLADIICTIKTLKAVSRESDPVDAYDNTQMTLSVPDVASAAGLLALNKQMSGSESPTKLINSIMANYIGMVNTYAKQIGGKPFKADGKNSGIKNVAIYRAIHETIESGGSVDTLIKSIGEEVKTLTSNLNPSDDIQNMVIIRSAADLATYAGFLHHYKKEIDPMITGAVQNSTSVVKIKKMLGEFYADKKGSVAIDVPGIFQHRFPRTNLYVG